MNVIEGPQGAEFSPGAAAHVPPTAPQIQFYSDVVRLINCYIIIIIMEPHMSTLAIGDDMSHVSETRDMSSDL